MKPRPDNAATPRPVSFVHPHDGDFPSQWTNLEGGQLGRGYVTADEFGAGVEEGACPCYEGFPLGDDPIDSSV
jgi:hypothetical protein